MVNGRELLAGASVQMLTKTTPDELVPACEIFLFYLFTNNLYVPTEIRIHKVIEKSMGYSVSAENSAKIAPMTAPVAKRNIPISELAVPAVRGNSSKTAALALLDTTDTIPT